jgi:imidazolonepropionase-like amidohydrolase
MSEGTVSLRCSRRVVLLATTLLLSLSASIADGPKLLRGGDLYTVSHGVLGETDLLIEGGKIAAIGRDLEAPAGCDIVDVRGRRVYPGLIAPFTTLGLIEIGAVRATDDRNEVGEVTPEVSAHVAYAPDSDLLPTVRSHGVTTVQVVPTGSGIAGRSFLTHLAGWTKEDAGIVFDEGLIVTWPSVAIRTGWWVETGPEEQKKRISENRERILDSFQTARAYHHARKAGLNVEYDPRWEAMRPVFEGDLPVYVRADDERQIVEAVVFAERFGLDVVLVGGAEADRVAELLAERDVPVLLGSTTSLPTRPDDPYDARFTLPAELERAGVRFALGHLTWGAWDIRNLPFQAGQAIAFGLDPDRALRAVTLSTAEILGIDEHQGSLDVGKDATLFVSAGDVLDVLGQNVERMWIEGREVTLDDRHKRLYREYREKRAVAAPGIESRSTSDPSSAVATRMAPAPERHVVE